MSAPSAVRLDVWLDVACLFKTRSAAQKACRGGKIEVNGVSAPPHRLLRVGDELRITRGPGRWQMVVVRGLTERHLAKAEARTLYEDRTPPPSPQEIEARSFERVFHAAEAGRPAPDRRQRRELRRLKGRF